MKYTVIIIISIVLQCSSLEEQTRQKRSFFKFFHNKGGYGGAYPYYGHQVIYPSYAYNPQPVYDTGYTTYNTQYTIERQVPVAVPVLQPYPVTIERKVPVTVKIPVKEPYPVLVPQPYPVTVEKPVTYVVEKRVEVPVTVRVPYVVKVPQPYPNPVPVTITKQVHVVPQPAIVKQDVPVYVGTAGTGGGGGGFGFGFGGGFNVGGSGVGYGKKW